MLLIFVSGAADVKTNGPAGRAHEFINAPLRHSDFEGILAAPTEAAGLSILRQVTAR